MPKRTRFRFIARMIEGAGPLDMPGFIPPQLATPKSKAEYRDITSEGLLRQSSFKGLKRS
jgi:hypothetical protein